jgi:hypothetical protein
MNIEPFAVLSSALSIMLVLITVCASVVAILIITSITWYVGYHIVTNLIAHTLS